MRKVAWIMAAALTIAAPSLAVAQDTGKDTREVRQDAREVAQDKKDVKQDKKDIKQDKADLKDDRKDGDKADAKKSSFENFATAIGLNAKDGAGWDLLEAAAEEVTAEEVQDRKGVMCAPASPSFDENAFDELTKETKTEVEEWGYPTAAGVEVHATAKPNSPVVEKLGLNLVRVLDSDESNDADAPLKVVTPAGKVGYVDSDAVVPIVFDQLCYSKDGGSWKIAGYAGGD